MNKIFAENIKCILEDGTELENVTGLVIDNKRAYKAQDGTYLRGTKKFKKAISADILVTPLDFNSIIMLEDY
tara:strand:- start:5948 stop:6163 length:216 start_codon:yes stop_codon:yes gene_type:complete